MTGLVEEDRYSKPGNDSFKKVLDSKDNFVFVAEEDSKPVGFITVSARSVIRYPKPILQVDELFVDADFRKHGVGRQLIQAVEAFAQDNGYPRIYIESAYKHDVAHKFYEKNGYTNRGYYFQKVF